MVCAGIARERGFSVVALTVDYNQRHRVELDAARKIASQLANRNANNSPKRLPTLTLV